MRKIEKDIAKIVLEASIIDAKDIFETGTNSMTGFDLIMKEAHNYSAKDMEVLTGMYNDFIVGYVTLLEVNNKRNKRGN